MTPNVFGSASHKHPSIDEDAKRVGTVMVGVLIAGDLIAVSWDLKFWSPILMWSAALSAAGWLLGFIFGIPRSLAKGVQTKELNPELLASSQIPLAPPTGPVSSLISPNISFGVNTNLEEISDWLTKIIVGITLVQLDKAQAHLLAAARLIALSIGGAHQVSFAYALMLYFSISGFLGSYLLTRLYLQKALRDAS